MRPLFLVWLAMAAFGLLVVSEERALVAGQNCPVNPGPRCAPQAAIAQSYSPWRAHPKKDKVWFSEYTLSVNGVTQRHYIIWYEDDSQHCYCYNPDSQTYWGRWNYNVGSITFSRVPQRARVPNLPPGQLLFQGNEEAPLAPSTVVPMTPPLPSDLPPV